MNEVFRISAIVLIGVVAACVAGMIIAATAMAIIKQAKRMDK